MLSLEEIAAVRVAINLCNCPELKREILCETRSDYHANKQGWLNKEDWRLYRDKQFWYEMTGRKAGEILKNLGLPKRIHGEILDAIFSLGTKMLAWAEYHETILGFSREFSHNFFNSSFLTQPGIVDNKRAAEDLMKDKTLSTKQKYKLSCLYCFTDNIPDLYTQMVRSKDDPGRNIGREPALVMFWDFYQMGLYQDLEEKSLNELMFKKAVMSGNKSAVEYCMDRTYLGREIVAIEAAVNILLDSQVNEDGLVYFNWAELPTPSDYYADVLYLLLSKFTASEMEEFFSKDPNRCRALKYFLNWPYQNYFMRLAKLILEFFTEEEYVFFIEVICDNIESSDGALMYGAQKNKQILKEVWQQMPDNCKRYIFNEEIIFALLNLMKLKNFTRQDEENIRVILNSATDEEKQNIIFSNGWRYIYTDLIAQERWEILYRFASMCFLSKQQADDIMKSSLCTETGWCACISYARNGEWNEAESLIRWIASTEQEMNILKKELIYSWHGMASCYGLIRKGVAAVDRFIKWHFLFEEEVTAFKKELIFTERIFDKCKDLAIKNELELFDEFTNFCLTSEDDIRELKRYVASHEGRSICVELLLGYADDNFYRECDGMRGGCHCYRFNGCRWEEVEKFLTWCFSSEEEIIEFKRNIFQETAMFFHYLLVTSNYREDADIFLAWLGLSAEEIKELKKETLFSHRKARDKFIYLMHMKESDETKQEAIGFLLRWYLTDKETLLKFSDDFKRWYIENEEVNEEKGEVLKNFDLAIMRYVDDLDEEQKERTNS